MFIQRLFALPIVVLVIALVGCAPPTTGKKDPVTIAVNPVGPAEWGYTIATTGSSNITKIVFTLSITGCSVKSKPLGWRDGVVNGGIQVEEATGAKSVAITLKCDANNGPIYVDAHILGGAANTVGPIAGPT